VTSTSLQAAAPQKLAAARPPSMLLGVAHLGYRDQLVEIDAVALV
jgi:hypothetical protein